MSMRLSWTIAAVAPKTGLVLWLVCACVSCASPATNLYKRFEDQDPGVRLAAVVDAGNRKDPNAAPYLVDRLGDSETEVRFFAALALEKITGQTMGYRYYEPADRREEAIGRWRVWLKARAATQPASQPATEPVGGDAP